MIMEIHKAPTLRIKALNKHILTHIMYIVLETVTSLTASTFLYIYIYTVFLCPLREIQVALSG